MEREARPSNLRRLLGLSGRERWLLFEAWWRLLAAATRLRLAPRRTLARALVESGPTGRSRAPAGTSDRESAGTSLALAGSRAAAHHFLRMTCLPRALALQRMLRARGIAARLRIGVRKESGSIAAHAWVEVEGLPLGEPEAVEERFQPFVAEPQP